MKKSIKIITDMNISNIIWWTQVKAPCGLKTVHKNRLLHKFLVLRIAGFHQWRIYIHPANQLEVPILDFAKSNVYNYIYIYYVYTLLKNVQGQCSSDWFRFLPYQWDMFFFKRTWILAHYNSDVGESWSNQAVALTNVNHGRWTLMVPYCHISGQSDQISPTGVSLK